LSSHVRAELGQLCYEWNRLEEASVHFQAGAALAQTWRNWEGLVPCTLGFARLRRLAGLPDAGQMLVQLSAQYTGIPPSLRAELQAWQQLWALEDGSLLTQVLPVHPAPGEPEEVYTLVACRALLTVGRADDVIPALAHVARTASEKGRLRQAVAASVLLAQARDEAGEEAEALCQVEAALHLAAPEGYCRTWLDAGPTVRSLLLRQRQRLETINEPRDRVLAQYVDALLAAWPGTPGGNSEGAPARGVQPAGGSIGVVEPLSPRELEVLQLLATGLSNQEIAGELVVALTTVKTHVAAIYRKLDVANRTQAVTRARQLGLLPSV
jgi:LuxR family maltose regulon positive regulatory protein